MENDKEVCVDYVEVLLVVDNNLKIFGDGFDLFYILEEEV